MRTGAGSIQIDLPEFKKQAEIPRRLHQICLPNSDHMPDAIRDNIAQLRAAHPNWEYQIYDADRAESFILSTYGSDMLVVYQRLEPAYPAARADLLRYLLCYAFGGIYLDLKSQTGRNFEDILQPGDQFLINQWQEHRDAAAEDIPHPELRHIPGGEYTIWCIACVAGHPFLRSVILQCIDNINTYHPFKNGVGQHGILRLTGPVMFSTVVHQLRPLHSHRMVMLDPDEGMSWTIYDGFARHRGKLGQHYSNVALPLVQGSAVTRAVTVGLYRHVAPKLRWFFGAVRRRISLGRAR